MAARSPQGARGVTRLDGMKAPEILDRRRLHLIGDVLFFRERPAI
jgi:hypothetical protein